MPHYPYTTPAGEPLTTNKGETYTDGDASSITNTRNHEWNHSIPDVLNALICAGLRADRLEEHDFLDWPLTPSWVEENGVYYPPAEIRGTFPQEYSVWATKS